MSVTSDRARVASLTRSRATDDPALVAARQQLKTSCLEQYIRRTVEAAPPLTDEQRARLAALLAPAVGGGAR